MASMSSSVLGWGFLVSAFRFGGVGQPETVEQGRHELDHHGDGEGDAEHGPPVRAHGW